MMMRYCVQPENFGKSSSYNIKRNQARYCSNGSVTATPPEAHIHVGIGFCFAIKE